VPGFAVPVIDHQGLAGGYGGIAVLARQQLEGTVVRADVHGMVVVAGRGQVLQVQLRRGLVGLEGIGADAGAKKKRQAGGGSQGNNSLHDRGSTLGGCGAADSSAPAIIL